MANVTTGSNTDQFEYRTIYTSGGVLQDDENTCYENTNLNDTTQRTRTFYPTTANAIDENSSFTVLIKDKGTGAITTSRTINIPTATTLAGGSSGASSASTNPYKTAVLAARQLYTSGESTLTDADIIKINDIECYALQISEDSTKAELITKNIYDARFDTTNSTYNYVDSSLKTWMDNFYTNELGGDEHIIDTTVIAYTKGSYSIDLTTFTMSTLTQKVFALDGVEAKNNALKFSWCASSTPNYGFWTTAGNSDDDVYANAFYVFYHGRFYSYGVDRAYCGARPAFWISLK